MATVLEKQKQPKMALTYFTKATDLAPRSALTRFKKARALMALGEMQLALNELMILKDIAPDEAMVHFLLGRLYKSLQDKGQAVRHFTIALNSDPKVCLIVLIILAPTKNQIRLASRSKEAIENLEE
jgi:anaphase-promoting complex subunit 3